MYNIYALMDLLWLTVRKRIDYKIALFVYKCLHGIGLHYLTGYYGTLICTANQHHQLFSQLLAVTLSNTGPQLSPMLLVAFGARIHL